MTERETPVRVLLERHLIDLQLSNSPAQYIISRVLARLMELEQTIDDLERHSVRGL